MQTIEAGVLYFVLVFGAGFVPTISKVEHTETKLEIMQGEDGRRIRTPFVWRLRRHTPPGAVVR
jgi:hypothetical protein